MVVRVRSAAAAKAIWDKLRAPNIVDLLNYDVKRTRKLKRLLANNVALAFKVDLIRWSHYRPFTSVPSYYSNELNEDLYRLTRIFMSENLGILVS
jgi:predicted helicase